LAAALQLVAEVAVPLSVVAVALPEEGVVVPGAAVPLPVGQVVVTAELVVSVPAAVLAAHWFQLSGNCGRTSGRTWPLARRYFRIVDSARRQWPPAQQQSAGYRSPGRTLQWAHSRRHIWYKPCPTRLFCLVIRRTALKASWLEIDLPGQVPTREFCPADSFAKAECMLICRKWHPRAEHPASGFAAQKAAIN